MAIELPELLLPDSAAWHDWLEHEHAGSTGVRLVLHKKGGAVTSLTYAEALDEALCFGWIDGQLSTRDSGSYCVRFTPRRPRSLWSARNVGHVARLEAEGRLRAAGRAAVRAAQEDGRWDRAYAGQATAEVPADLAAALDAEPAARVMFETLTAGNRYSILYRVNAVKRPETRARKIAQYVEMLARGEAPHPQSPEPG